MKHVSRARALYRNLHFWLYLLSLVGKFLGDIKGVKTYIGKILVIRKDSFTKNIGQRIVIFSRICNT